MSEPYIVRFEYNRTHGWLVKVPGRPNKLFSDSKYPDSLAAARAHRTALMEGRPVRGGSRPRESFALNTSGTVGVSRYIDRYGKFVGWLAYASVTPRRQVAVPFTFKQHGRAAKRRARAARELLIRLNALYHGEEEDEHGTAAGRPRRRRNKQGKSTSG